MVEKVMGGRDEALILMVEVEVIVVMVRGMMRQK